MPLIILTGYPCSGLSYRANQLSTLLSSIQDSLTATIASKGRYKFHVVHSHDESHPRTVYDTARSEKEARAVVYGRVKRALGQDTFVIVDGMNYIKGWRYQLWCESKAAETTCCVEHGYLNWGAMKKEHGSSVIDMMIPSQTLWPPTDDDIVHVGTPIDQCIVNNESRIRKRKMKNGGEDVGERAGANQEPEAEVDRHSHSISDDEEPYPPELLQNLIFRYEEPTTHSRWDKPLFTVPWSDPAPPVEDIWTALTGISVSKEKSATDPPLSTASNPISPPSTNTPSISATGTSARTSLPRPKIVPHQATIQPTTTDPSALHALEKCTAGIINALRTFSLEHPSASAATATTAAETAKLSLGPGISISVPGAETPVFIPAAALASTPTDELAGAGGILSLPRLQRLRRQWVGMNRAYLGQGHARGQKGLRTEQAGDAFVRFLNAEFEGMEE
ncbi:toxin-insensitive protein [Histoplasma capsulatum var. duboisii H88]|uniref:Toxin-insensitive protein n=1 Tax=Ajellomyces capsulatus (strain H88) TaxID=544711 RepID=F0UPJ3_AJEC8|nr:toxin-insensitive protein [Histoplasma capsulatum var. duboisii H88]